MPAQQVLLTEDAAALTGAESDLQQHHGRIVEILRNRLGFDHAALFAAPSDKPGGLRTWSTGRAGPARHAQELAPEEAAALRARADRILAEVRGLGQTLSAEGGPSALVGSILTRAAVMPEAGLFSVGGKPVLVRWGAAQTAAISQPALDTDTPRLLAAASTAPVAAASPDIIASTMSDPVRGPPLASDSTTVEVPRAVAAAPSSTTAPAPSDGALAKGLLIAFFTLTLLVGLAWLSWRGWHASGHAPTSTPGPLTSDAPRQDPSARDGPGPLGSTAHQGIDASPDGKTGALSNEVLAKVLEDATPLVIIVKGDSLGSGSAFFITDTIAVTNRHVVEGASGGTVYLASRALGGVRQAQVVNQSASSEVGSPDFALLRLSSGKAASTLKIGPPAPKLLDVIAAGFPGLVTQDDPGFKRLIEGDARSVPDMNLTRGVVQSRQEGEGGTALLAHTANINPGNSGGPLVDACGRVVGVNTFFKANPAQVGKVDFAIGVETLKAFLGAARTEYRTESQPCAVR